MEQGLCVGQYNIDIHGLKNTYRHALHKHTSHIVITLRMLYSPPQSCLWHDGLLIQCSSTTVESTLQTHPPPVLHLYLYSLYNCLPSCPRHAVLLPNLLRRVTVATHALQCLTLWQSSLTHISSTNYYN